MNPVLVIAIGKTGLESYLWLKEKINEKELRDNQVGSCFNFIKFLVIDTDDFRSAGNNEDLCIRFSDILENYQDDFYCLSSTPLKRNISDSNQEVNKENNTVAQIGLSEITQTQPSAGSNIHAFYSLFKANKIEILDRCSAKIEQATNVAYDRSEQDTRAQIIPQIFIIASLFEPLSCAITLALQKNISSYFLNKSMPNSIYGIISLAYFPSLPKISNAEIYAALKELDAAINDSLSFNMCFFIERCNSRNLSFDEHDHLDFSKMISNFLYLSFFSDYLREVNAIMRTRGNTTQNRSLKYNSFSTSSIIFPARDIIDICSHRLGKEILKENILKLPLTESYYNNLKKMKRKESIALPAEAYSTSFVDTNLIISNLIKDRLAEEVEKISINPKQFYTGKLCEVLEKIRKIDNNIENNKMQVLKERIGNNLKNIKESGIIYLKNEIDGLIQTKPNGIGRARLLLFGLKNSKFYENSKSEDKSRASYLMDYDNYKTQFDKLLANQPTFYSIFSVLAILSLLECIFFTNFLINRLPLGFFGFLIAIPIILLINIIIGVSRFKIVRKEINKLIFNYILNVMNKFNFRLDEWIEEAVNDFYNNFKKEIDKENLNVIKLKGIIYSIYKKTDSISKKLSICISQNDTSGIDEQKYPEDVYKSIENEIDIAGLSINYLKDLNMFINWRKLEEKDAGTMRVELMHKCREKFSYLKKQNIVDILEKKLEADKKQDDSIEINKTNGNEPRVETKIDRMLTFNCPFLRYNQGDLGDYNPGSISHIYGCELPNEGLLKNILGRKIANSNLSITIDEPYEITFLYSIIGLPLFSFQTVNNLRKDYLRLKDDKASSLHLNPEDFLLQDIFPDKDEGEDFNLLSPEQCCTIGLALGIINTGNNGFSISLKNKMKILGNTKNEVIVCLKENKSTIATISKLVKKAIDSKGNEKSISIIEKYSTENNIEEWEKQEASSYIQKLKRII